MKIRRLAPFSTSTALMLTGCATAPQAETDGWRALFNGGDLVGWETYLGPAYSERDNAFVGEPTGVNVDPDGVFTVVQEDGRSAIRISGEHFGGISTSEEFENYHLRLEFKWGRDKHAPRANGRRDSGLLYHATGEHGQDGSFWMHSQEFQIQEGDCGDYWGLGSEVDVMARPLDDGRFIYDPEGELMHFGARSPHNRNVKKDPDGEHPTGEWNTLDLYALGGTSLHVINGVRTMRLENSRQIIDGRPVPLTRGMLQIQSEGAEIFYRNIMIRPITESPPLQ
jgi:hypothetical protein